MINETDRNLMHNILDMVINRINAGCETDFELNFNSIYVYKRENGLVTDMVCGYYNTPELEENHNLELVLMNLVTEQNARDYQTRPTKSQRWLKEMEKIWE